MKIQKFQEYFLNEKAVSFEDVLSNEPDSVIIKYVSHTSTREQMNLVLYNYKEKIVEGFIQLDRFKADDEYMISKSYAIDKHGPMMYDVALSEVSPDGIIPDRMIRPAAQKIWEYYDTQRPDVKKKNMPTTHYWYAKEYDVDLEHEKLKDPKVLNLINKIYYVDKPFPHVDELIKKGIEVINSEKLVPKQIVNTAETVFFKRYNDELQK